MTLREYTADGSSAGDRSDDHVVPADTTPVPDLYVILADPDDARALAPLGRSARHARGTTAEIATPVLVATGPDPFAVDAALDDLGAPAGRVLLLDGPCEDWAQEAARLVVRLEALLVDGPAGVVVRGGSEAALAAARCAVRRQVPLLHVSSAGATGHHDAATEALVGGLVAWQRSSGGMSPPVELDLLVRRRLDPPRAIAPAQRTAEPTVVRMPTTRSGRSGTSGDSRGPFGVAR